MDGLKGERNLKGESSPLRDRLLGVCLPQKQNALRAVVVPRRRLSVWCAVECVCGGPGGYVDRHFHRAMPAGRCRGLKYPLLGPLCQPPQARFARRSLTATAGAGGLARITDELAFGSKKE